jgi:histidine ammonia-lyase
MTAIELTPGELTLAQLRRVAREGIAVSLADSCRAGIAASADAIAAIVARGATVYGVNTGFGRLARTPIPRDKLTELQRNLVLSHSVGTGPLLPDDVVRTILVLKAAALARGYSGVRWPLIEALLRLLAADVLPCIPSKGSVGASGDLAPLAHLAAALLGVGEVRIDGRIAPAKEGLARAELAPLELAPKEGLALLNGTQVSTALALHGLFAAEDAFAAAMCAGGLSLEAARGSHNVFDARIQEVRGQPGQIRAAAVYRALLQGSAIRDSHLSCDRVQDPYSLRCQPQVMGACLDHLDFAAAVFARESNAVSDNPLVFASDGAVLSGGNFHAEPVAMAADVLALAITEIGALSERRIALLMDKSMTGLPPFLAAEGGVHSGFMIAHVTAAALASENKSLAHPASVDSLPTSANQEDHVSMATHAARRLLDMADNTAGIVGIELLCAAHGVELLAPLTTSAPLRAVLGELRAAIPPHLGDRFLAPDIAAAKAWVQRGAARSRVRELLPSER